MKDWKGRSSSDWAYKDGEFFAIKALALTRKEATELAQWLIAALAEVPEDGQAQ